jgi:hypothetical protein
MATLAAVLDNLRAEIKAEILAIVPTRFIDRAFERFELFYQKETGEVITGQQRPRLFEIGDCRLSQNFVKGRTVDESVYEIPLTFCYPTGEQWGIAATDDLAQIRRYFVDNPSDVTGVSGRWINYETPSITDHPNDPYRYYTVNMVAYLMVDY